MDMRTQERKAWEEVKNRLEFMARTYDGIIDPMACRMASQKLGDAMREHAKLYEDRMAIELGPRT